MIGGPRLVLERRDVVRGEEPVVEGEVGDEIGTRSVVVQVGDAGAAGDAHLDLRVDRLGGSPVGGTHERQVPVAVAQHARLAGVVRLEHPLGEDPELRLRRLVGAEEVEVVPLRRGADDGDGQPRLEDPVRDLLVEAQRAEVRGPVHRLVAGPKPRDLRLLKRGTCQLLRSLHPLLVRAPVDGHRRLLAESGEHFLRGDRTRARSPS